MKPSLLKNYLVSFDRDKDTVDSLVKFAKTAIRFIFAKDLFADFMKYSADEAMEEYNEQFPKG